MMACLVDREKFVIVSNIVQLSVESSCSTIVLPSRPEVAKSTIDSAAMPATIARVRGILALSGSRGLSLSSETLPKSGSYSISFWIKLMEEPTGKFRTLFYKGIKSYI
jgi:hypothetical protein